VLSLILRTVQPLFNDRKLESKPVSIKMRAVDRNMNVTKMPGADWMSYLHQRFFERSGSLLQFTCAVALAVR
jgi:hypothetical protein